MRADQAKAIPMTRLLTALGYEPKQSKGRDVWYFSPFHEEKTASFKLNTEWNSWYDFSMGKGGNIIDFVMAYFQLHTVSAALVELDRIEGIQGSDRPLPLFPSAPMTTPAGSKAVPLPAASVSTPTPAPAPGIVLKKVKPLENAALIQYLESRAIPVEVARAFVQEAYYTVTGRDRTYFALAFPNASGGFELRNPYFQGVIGSKDVSLIMPDLPDLFEVTIFEGFMDFLSARVRWRTDNMPALVLNSVALKDKAIVTIHEYGFTHIRLYLDRDEAGRKLTEAFQALDGLTVVDASGVYAGFKDFNEFLMGGSRALRA